MQTSDLKKLIQSALIIISFCKNLLFRRGSSSRGEQSKVGVKDKNKEPFKMNLPKNQIKLTLKTATGKPVNQTVLEKLGSSREELETELRKRKLENPHSSETVKQRKLENEVTFLHLNI